MPILNKRQTELLSMIRSRSSCNVHDLFPLFDVSEATLRKDLTLLQEMHLIQRTRGEVHTVSDTDVTPMESRSTQNIKAKQAIARAAVSFIKEGDSIILDSGSTTLEIARLLTSMNDLKVVTNSIPIATVLANSRVEVLMSGGMLLKENLGLQGPEAEKFFRDIEVDIAFIAASGVRPQVGLSSQNSLECSLKQAMMRAGRYKCAVIDSSKFEKSGIYLYAHFDDFDTIISEAKVPNTALEQLAEKEKVNWVIANDSFPQIVSA